ncbi:InlB B-repeat-containing protein, partial [Tenacibaculum sp. MEBiC06402]
GWSGDASGTTNPLNITMDADKTVTANFSPIQRTLTVNAANGSVTASPNPVNGTYDDGTVVTLTAVPDSGYQFDSWSGDATGNTTQITVTMDGDKTVTASFSVTLGINDEKFKVPFKLYPNPVEDIIHIESKEIVEKIKIYNVLGKEVVSSTMSNESINVSSLSKGLYFMIIETTSGKGVRRFIKK